MSHKQNTSDHKNHMSQNVKLRYFAQCNSNVWNYANDNTLYAFNKSLMW